MGLGEIKQEQLIKLTSKQLGKKIGKHATDFGLDPSKEEDRETFAQITKAILNEPDQIARGSWRGQKGVCRFFIKGNDVVVINENLSYVTTLKDGVLNNPRIRGALGLDT